ncbi:hypothetical protein AVEN_90835-1 [Araneus ventricosus]|uniref:Uncharacterized protein n=1 Tax=Araneus ventricosus TaxID=182803 RepID=A0A4Y2TNY2_ARAVE|nr:hypothetical protein AVEN_90835-1 [Araneus ventricosus]
MEKLFVRHGKSVRECNGEVLPRQIQKCERDTEVLPRQTRKCERDNGEVLPRQIQKCVKEIMVKFFLVRYESERDLSGCKRRVMKQQRKDMGTEDQALESKKNAVPQKDIWKPEDQRHLNQKKNAVPLEKIWETGQQDQWHLNQNELCDLLHKKTFKY